MPRGDHHVQIDRGRGHGLRCRPREVAQLAGQVPRGKRRLGDGSDSVGNSPGTAAQQLQMLADLAWWMHARGLAIHDLSPEAVEVFCRPCRQSHRNLIAARSHEGSSSSSPIQTLSGRQQRRPSCLAGSGSWFGSGGIFPRTGAGSDGGQKLCEPGAGPTCIPVRGHTVAYIQNQEGATSFDHHYRPLRRQRVRGMTSSPRRGTGARGTSSRLG